MHRLVSSDRNARICAALGAVAIAWSSIFVKLSHASPATAAIFRCAYAVPFLALFALLEDRRYGARHWGDRRPAIVASIIGPIFGPTKFVPVWPGAGWLILLALTSQVAGWMLITMSLPRLPAAMTSLLLMIQPIGSMILGAIIFSEDPSVLQLTGVILVIGAVIFATRGPFTTSPKLTLGEKPTVGVGFSPRVALEHPIEPAAEAAPATGTNPVPAP